jgi:hypothetical protein
MDLASDATTQGCLQLVTGASTGGVRTRNPVGAQDFAGGISNAGGLALVVVANPYLNNGTPQPWVNGYPCAPGLNQTTGVGFLPSRPLVLGALRLASAWVYSAGGMSILEMFMIDITSVADTGVWRQYVDGLINFYLEGGYPTAETGQPALYKFGTS